MKCLDGVQKTWPRDGILRVQISHNSTVRMTNQKTAHNDMEGDILINETLSDDITLHKNMSTTATNQSNLDLFHSIPEDKPSLSFKPTRETLLHDSSLDGESVQISFFP